MALTVIRIDCTRSPSGRLHGFAKGREWNADAIASHGEALYDHPEQYGFVLLAELTVHGLRYRRPPSQFEFVQQHLRSKEVVQFAVYAELPKGLWRAPSLTPEGGLFGRAPQDLE